MERRVAERIRQAQSSTCTKEIDKKVQTSAALYFLITLESSKSHKRNRPKKRIRRIDWSIWDFWLKNGGDIYVSSESGTHVYICINYSFGHYLSMFYPQAYQIMSELNQSNSATSSWTQGKLSSVYPRACLLAPSLLNVCGARVETGTSPVWSRTSRGALHNGSDGFLTT